MYSLFMGLWTMLFSKVQYQILILGLDDAGKTTFLEQVKHLYAHTASPEELKIPPTVGLNIGKLDVGRVRFLFWDLGGQASLRVLWDKYYSESHGVVYVVDSSDPARLDEAARELAKLARDKDLLDAPLLVLANKQDVKGAMSGEGVARAMGLPPGSATLGPVGSLVPSSSSAGLSAAAATTASSSSSSSSTSSSSSSSLSLSAATVSPLSLRPAAAAAAAAASASALQSGAFDGHVVRVVPISALSGQGISRAVDLLLDVLPKARRTLQMQQDKV